MGWAFAITEEMRAMGLQGNRLIVFALIHSCTLKGNGCYYGGVAYLCEVCGISRRTAFNLLDGLVQDGFIIKSEIYKNGIKFTSYQTSAEIARGVQKIHSDSAEIAPNNVDDNINISSLSNKARAFIKPSIEEIRAYATEYGYIIDAESFYNHYESNGWKVGKVAMKDWQAAVRNWVKRQKEFEAKQQTSRQPFRKESPFEHNLRVADKMFGTDLHDQIYGNK